MRESFPRVTLFVPGAAESLAAWDAALHGLRLEGEALVGDGLDTTVEVEWVDNDGSFGAAFSFGTVAPETLSALDQAPGALVLYCHADLREGRASICALVERLRDAGALAVRLEQSKVGWAIDDWLELMASDDPWAWHRAAIAFLGDEGVVQSCGMHAFCLPDVYTDADAEALDDFMATLNVYQMAEDPLIVSGQTFAPDAETPRRVLQRWPDVGYPSDHPCHNPYGVWRLGPAGGEARPVSELAHVFMPALCVLLRALEDREGAPLTRERVEATRDGGTCMAMEQADAQKLERSRGYADLDPELAWEQWQLLRRV